MLLSLMLFVAPAFLQPQQDVPYAEALLIKASQQIQAATSVRTTFQQTLSNPLLGNSSTAQGELLRKRPNLFSITFTDPPTGDRIVSDGKHIWLYLPSSAPDQVIKSALTGSQKMLVDPLTQVLTASTEEYTRSNAGQLTIDKQTVYGVKLKARKPDALFTEAVVWLDKSAAVKRVDVTEPSGVQRKITILTYQTNASLPSGSFTFTPPPKTRVIDR